MAMTTHTTSELREFLDDNADKLNKITMTTYRNDYKRFRTQMKDRKNIYNLTQKEIIEIVKNTEFNKKALLNIAIVFLKWKEKPINRLIIYRKDLEEMRDEKQADKNKAQIDNSGATYEDLMKALNEATGTDYILFYLLIKLNTRNNDLIVRMINRKDKKELLNTEDNFMIVSPSKSTYIRQDYKTASKYGIKDDVIRDEKFVRILTEEQPKREYLFVNNKNKPYKQTEIGKFIKSRFAKYLDTSEKKTNLSQSTIYKIIQAQVGKSGAEDLLAMKQMANNRGHLLDTQMKYYSQNNYNTKQAEEIDFTEEDFDAM